MIGDWTNADTEIETLGMYQLKLKFKAGSHKASSDFFATERYSPLSIL